jgi:hypothetical protein
VTLFAEAVGVLFVAAMARAVLARSVSLGGAVTAVAVVLGGLAFWAGVWPQARELVSDHAHNARLSREQALALPGTALPATAAPAREDVLAWADSVLPRRARVFLDCPQPAPCTNPLANWITYRLEPRVFTDSASQAQWVLFYGTPARWLATTSVMEFAPGYAIGRLRP